MTNWTETTSSRRLACGRCGTEFACNPTGPCWCAEASFRVPMPAAGAGDCLCPTCLRKLAAELTRAVAT